MPRASNGVTIGAAAHYQVTVQQGNQSTIQTTSYRSRHALLRRGYRHDGYGARGLRLGVAITPDSLTTPTDAPPHHRKQSFLRHRKHKPLRHRNGRRGSAPRLASEDSSDKRARQKKKTVSQRREKGHRQGA